MGSSAVLDITASPNMVTCILLPLGSDRLMRADLVILGRRQEYPMGLENNFICSEISQQIISTVDERTMGQVSSDRNRLLKQIETISLFQPVDDKRIKCVQRTATFLVPSQQDPMAMRLWQVSQGQPIDVRFFNVSYSKMNVI
jgi:hypothetical protein